MSDGRKVIVAGGTGLIGRALVPALATAGAEVVVLTRQPDRETQPGARNVGWDGRTAAAGWTGELAGAAAVVNLAGTSIGSGRWTKRRKQAILQSRTGSTSALVDAIGSVSPTERPAVLVNASGIDYTGFGEAEVDEHSAPGTSYLARVCVDWEAAAQRAEQHGTRVVCMRTPLVLAHDALALRLMALPFRLFAGGPLGNGRQWFPWVHIEDAVSLYTRALHDETLAGPVNMVAPEVPRQRDAARELGHALHRPSWLPAPAPVLRLALGEQADLLLHGQLARSTKLDASAFRYPTLGAALVETFSSR
jgi:uncharacterized protein (TIGR01777 family)